MKILAIETKVPGKTLTDFQPYLKTEAERVWELQKSGIIREIYFTQETHQAVLILEGESKASAEKVLNSLFSIVKPTAQVCSGCAGMRRGAGFDREGRSSDY